MRSITAGLALLLATTALQAAHAADEPLSMGMDKHGLPTDGMQPAHGQPNNMNEVPREGTEKPNDEEKPIAPANGQGTLLRPGDSWSRGDASEKIPGDKPPVAPR